MAGAGPVVAIFEANVAGALEAISAYKDSLVQLEERFVQTGEAMARLDEQIAASERAFVSARTEMLYLGEGAAELEAKLVPVGDAASDIAKGLNAVGRAAEASATKMQAADDAYTRFLAQAEDADRAIGAFSSRLASLNAELTGMAKAMQESAAATAELAAASDKAAANSSKIVAANAATKGSLNEMRSSLLMIGGAFDLVDFGALKIAGTFQANMNRLQTEAGLSTERINQFAGSMGGLQSKVIDVGNATGFAGTEISNALYEPISAGLSLSDALNTVKYSAEEAKISGSSLEDTTTALTAIMKDFGGSISSPEQGMADLNAIVGQGMMRFQDFNQAIKNWAPTASTFGVSLLSAGAGLAFMTDRGESATSAGTKLAQVMAMMVGQTTQAGKLMGALGLSTDEVATSNEAMAGAMSTAHVTTSQLADDLRRPDGLAVALNDLKGHLAAAGLSADATDSVLVRAFGGGRQFKGLAELISNTDQLSQKFDQMSHDANIAHFEEQWKTVSDSFLQQWADMSAALKNFGIMVGTNLMPIAASITSVFAGMFRAIGENKTLISAVSASLGVLAVAFPIAAAAMFIAKMSETAVTMTLITGKIALLAAGFEYGATHLDSFWGVATLVVTSLIALASAAGPLMSVLSSMGSGFNTVKTAIGVFALNVEGAEAGMATFKAIGSGVVDFLTSGWGLALGAAAALIGIFSTQTDQGATAVDALTQALTQDSGALGQNSAAWVANTLQKNGGLAAAKAMGISTTDVTAAILGNGDALARVNGVINASKDTWTVYAGESQQADSTQTDFTDNAKILMLAMGQTKDSVNATVDAYQATTAATVKATEAQSSNTRAMLAGDSSQMDFSQSTMQVKDALSAASAAASKLTDALNLLNGGNMDAEKANLALKDSIDAMKKALQGGSDAIDDNTEKGRANIKAILDGASAAATHAEAVAKQTNSTDKGTAAFNADVIALQAQMRAAGLNEDQIKAMTTAYLQVPKNIDTVANLNTGQAMDDVYSLRAALEGIKDRTINVHVNTIGTILRSDGSGRTAMGVGMEATGGLVQHFAGGGVTGFGPGGSVSGPGTTSSDSIPTMLSDHEYVVRANAVAKTGTNVLDAINVGDLNSAYSMLGSLSGVNSGGGGIDMAALANAVGGKKGSDGPDVVQVFVQAQGSIYAQNDLQREIQQIVQRYAGRNNGPGWTGAGVS